MLDEFRLIKVAYIVNLLSVAVVMLGSALVS